MHPWNAQGKCVIHSITEIAGRAEEVLLNHKKAGLSLSVSAAGFDTGITPPPLPHPLHLYLALYLDRDRDCHLGRLQGADCSVAEQTSLFRQNTDVPFWQLRSEAFNPVTTNKGVCPLFVTHSVKQLPRILLSSLHKHDETAVRAALTLT